MGGVVLEVAASDPCWPWSVFTSPPGQDFIRHGKVDSALLQIDCDVVAILDERDRPTPRSLGRDVADRRTMGLRPRTVRP